MQRVRHADTLQIALCAHAPRFWDLAQVRQGVLARAAALEAQLDQTAAAAAAAEAAAAVRARSLDAELHTARAERAELAAMLAVAEERAARLVPTGCKRP